MEGGLSPELSFTIPSSMAARIAIEYTWTSEALHGKNPAVEYLKCCSMLRLRIPDEISRFLNIFVHDL